MPAQVELPTNLDHLRYFILRYSRDTQRFEMIEPNKANTYDLGDAFKTRAYFWGLGLEHLGGRAMDAAVAFGASQALLKEGRAYGLDLCKQDLDAGILRSEDADENRRAFSDDDFEPVFISGQPKAI